MFALFFLLLKGKLFPSSSKKANILTEQKTQDSSKFVNSVQLIFLGSDNHDDNLAHLYANHKGGNGKLVSLRILLLFRVQIGKFNQFALAVQR